MPASSVRMAGGIRIAAGFEHPTLWTFSGDGLPLLTFAAIEPAPVRD
jgi:hypothetical protein